MSGLARVAAGAAVLAVGVAMPGFARAGALRFPTGTPPYVVAAVTRYAMTPGNSEVTVVLVRLGRFPVVVVKGILVCRFCSLPPVRRPAHPNKFGPKRTFAELSFDAVSQRETSFGFGLTEAGVLSNWCGAGDCASRQTVALQSADAALNKLSNGDGEFYGLNLGKWQCDLAQIAGTCDTTISLGAHATVVTFRAEWDGLKSAHVYRVTVSLDGYVTAVHSSGDALPTVPPGATEPPAVP